MKKILLLVITSLLIVLPVCADYYTLEGPYLYVHFPKGYENLASKLMVQSEKIMAELKDEMDLQINGKSHFIIEDKIDLPNGYTTNVFYPSITFFPVFPGDTLLGGLGPNNDWFETLLWHEGTHLYHIEMTTKTNYYLSRILGRYPLFYPIWSSPTANIEGLAVVNETKYQKIGRGSDSIYPMILDAAIDADYLPDPRFTLGNYDLDYYDLAGFPYLYGWNFLEFLSQNYGENAPLALQEIFVNNPGRFFVPKYDSALRDLTGKSYKDLTDEWYVWLRQNYNLPNLEPEGKILQNSGQTIYPGFFDQEYFYYAKSGDSGGIYRINLETEKEELVKYIPNIYGNISKDNSGKLLYTALELDQKGNSFFNIYRYSQHKSEPIIKGERASAPLSTSSGIYYLSQKHPEGNAIYKRDLSGNLTLVYLSKPGEEILQFTVSSHDEVYVSLWREGGFVDLGLIIGNKITFLTTDHYSDTYPVLSSDETKLYFQSNRSGRYGIWVLDLKTAKVAPVVVNHYGAFKPISNPSMPRQLAFITYTDQGLKLGVHNLCEENSWMPLQKETLPERSTYPTLDELLSEEGYTLKKYSGLNWLKPTFWIPSVLGASAMGSDPLQSFLYSFGYNFNPFAELAQANHNLYATFDYFLNPLHSLSVSLESDLKSFTLNTIYSGKIPLGKNSLNLTTSANTKGVLSLHAKVNLPWGREKISGNNFCFGRTRFDLGLKDASSYEYSLGYGHSLKASRNLDYQLRVSFNHHKAGYLSIENYPLGQSVLFLESSLNWIFARPMWIRGASPTMWSEKMTVSPNVALLIGDTNWEIVAGLEFANTTALMYGAATLDLGIQAMYYPRLNRVMISPVIKF
ncbi:MAG: hypothetical protein WCS44_00095 [Bacillota bacterium]